MDDEVDLGPLVAEVTGGLDATPGRVATLLVGSTATGTRRPLSDVDFLVVVDDAVPWPVPVRDGGREAWTHESGVQIEVAFTSVSRLRRVMLEEAERGSALRLVQLTDGRLIGAAAAPYEELRAEAEARVRAGPPALEQQEIAWECYEIWMRLREVEGLIAVGSPALLVADALFEQIVGLTSRLRREWPPHRKHIFRAIAEDDDLLAPTARRYAGAGSDEARRLALTDLTARVGAAFGLTFSGSYRSRGPD